MPIRGELHSSIIIEPADGKIPSNDHFKQLAKVAGAAVLTAFDGPEQRPLAERCLVSVSAGPPVTVVPATDLRQIVQTHDSIVIASEELHEARVVRADGREGTGRSRVRAVIRFSLSRWRGASISPRKTSKPTKDMGMSPA